MQLAYSGLSDVGRVREHNEDAHLIADDIGLFVVADGMGGHLGGRTASKLAIKTFDESVRRSLPQIEEGAGAEPIASSPVPKLLAEAVRQACFAVYDEAQKKPELQGMGTTITGLLIQKDRAFIVHVGDSRCYLQRDDRIIQISDDHSLVNEQIKAGIITLEQARSSRLRNIITRSVGFEKDVAVDTFAMSLHVGDKFLVCSDGLANNVDDTEMGVALRTMAINDVPKMMIKYANDRGGDDNITVVCVEAKT